MNVTITVHAYVDIFSVAKHQRLHRGLEVLFDCQIPSPSICSNDTVFTNHIEKQIMEQGKQKFIELLREDTSVKRSVGGTIWEVKVNEGFRIFSSIKTYDEAVISGRLNNPKDICHDIGFMRQMVQEVFDDNHIQDEYFKGFLKNL